MANVILLRPGWHLKTRNLRIVWVATTNLTSKKDEKEATHTHTHKRPSPYLWHGAFFSQVMGVASDTATWYRLKAGKAAPDQEEAAGKDTYSET